jgi:hypothetical protein
LRLGLAFVPEDRMRIRSDLPPPRLVDYHTG